MSAPSTVLKVSPCTTTSGRAPPRASRRRSSRRRRTTVQAMRAAQPGTWAHTDDVALSPRRRRGRSRAAGARDRPASRAGRRRGRRCSRTRRPSPRSSQGPDHGSELDDLGGRSRDEGDRHVLSRAGPVCRDGLGVAVSSARGSGEPTKGWSTTVQDTPPVPTAAAPSQEAHARLGVVMPAYNEGTWVRRALDALEAAAATRGLAARGHGGRRRGHRRGEPCRAGRGRRSDRTCGCCTRPTPVASPRAGAGWRP